MVTKQNFRAQAKLVPLSELHLGKYITGNETSTSYLQLKDETELVRVNCIAVVVRREDQGSITIFTIDDGSDNINVRIFDGRVGFDNINVGQVVLIIGRVREYNTERYIAAEIIRPVKSRWLRYRSLLLHPKSNETRKIEIIPQENINLNTVSYSGAVNKEFDIDSSHIKKKVDEKEKNKPVVAIVPNILSEDVNPYVELMQIIVKLDTGEGVALESIIAESQFSNTEELLQKMMETGDIFQNLPGKVKVL